MLLDLLTSRYQTNCITQIIIITPYAKRLIFQIYHFGNFSQIKLTNKRIMLFDLLTSRYQTNCITQIIITPMCHKAFFFSKSHQNVTLTISIVTLYFVFVPSSICPFVLVPIDRKI